LKKKNELEKLLNGDPDRIDPNTPMECQTEFLPYDKTWEFPKKRLRLGLLFSLISHYNFNKEPRKEQQQITLFKIVKKDKNSDPVISDESSKPRPWVSKTPMKM
jgi:hypothetical protein